MATEEVKWWEEFDPEYNRMYPKYQYVDAVYECDPDEIRRADRYIIKKKQGEHSENYTDRLALAKVIPILGTVIDGYGGRVRSAKVHRSFSKSEGDGLGTPDNADTLVGKVYRNADGNGMNYEPLLALAVTQMSLKKHVWGLVEGYQVDEETGDLTGNPYVKVIPAESVPITVYKGTSLIAAVVIHNTVTRESPYEPAVNHKLFTVYTLDGHATYEEDEEGNMMRADEGTGDTPISYGGTTEPFYYYKSDNLSMSNRMLPIFKTELPMARYPAYSLASQNIVYMNGASELQNKHRACNILKLQLVTQTEDDKKSSEGQVAEGSTVLWIPADSSRDNKYIEPDAGSLRETREYLRESLSEILFSAHREYENSVSGGQRTATEAAQDAAEGSNSYLNVLVAARDEFETQVWRRMEQIEYPASPSSWGNFTVQTKRDFKPLDQDSVSARLRATYFGTETVPLGIMGKASVAKQIADSDDVEYESDEITAEIEQRDRNELAFTSLTAGAVEL